MKELFDQIMSIDHRANERLNEAVRRKEEAVRKVLEEKQKLSQQMEESAQNYLSDMEAAEKSNAQEQMQLCKERAEQEKDRLEQVYREKSRNEYSGSERISTRASRVLIQWEKYLRKTVSPNIADIPKTGSR